MCFILAYTLASIMLYSVLTIKRDRVKIVKSHSIIFIFIH